MNAELVGYMYGDKVDESVEDHGTIYHYLWTYYEDIESIYRERIFKLNI